MEIKIPDTSVEIKIGGIKCDNQMCSYRDMSVKFEDYEEYLGKSCPECGENLLTREDHDKSKTMIRLVNLYNSVQRYFRWINPFFYYRWITNSYGEQKRYLIESDANGDMKKIKEIK